MSAMMDIENNNNNQSMSSSNKVRDELLPWVEKYRPKNLDELVAHEEIITILNRLIESNQLPHLLFHGPPGTGKTSAIKACARKMYGDSYNAMTLELNASDDRGIDVVRQQIKDFAATTQLFSKGQTKLVILDEADAMTQDAQSALRRVIEKYTSNTRFCMICNYVNKIMPALQSRCTKFRFAPLKDAQIIDRLDHVITGENVNIDENGKAAIRNLAGGDMRRVLNLLQSTSMAYPQVTEEAVYLTAGAALPIVMEEIFSSLWKDDFYSNYKMILDATKTRGYALMDLVTEMSKRVAELEVPEPVLAHLLDKLSTIEFRLSHGTHDKIEAGALVGAFRVARSMMTE